MISERYNNNGAKQCKINQPKRLRQDLQNLLNTIENSNIQNPAVLHTYNLLCDVEALLQRYETASRETLFVLDLMSNREDCCKYLIKLHQGVLNENVMAFDNK